jgi:hypothetical protein
MHEKKEPHNFLCNPLIISDPGETRTPNLLIRSQMLYPLSYGTIAKSGANIVLLSFFLNVGK